MRSRLFGVSPLGATLFDGDVDLYGRTWRECNWLSEELTAQRVIGGSAQSRNANAERWGEAHARYEAIEEENGEAFAHEVGDGTRGARGGAVGAAPAAGRSNACEHPVNGANPPQDGDSAVGGDDEPEERGRKARVDFGVSRVRKFDVG